MISCENQVFAKKKIEGGVKIKNKIAHKFKLSEFSNLFFKLQTSEIAFI